MLDECDATATLKRQEKHAEAAFEKMMNEKSSDWFSQDQNNFFFRLLHKPHAVGRD